MPKTTAKEAKLRVVAEFRDLLPPTSKDCDDRLEAELLDEGCKDSIVIWKGKRIIVDGHRRHRFCKKHDIPFEIKEKEFASADEAMIWMLKFQDSRRNLQGLDAQKARNKLVELTAKTTGSVKKAVQQVAEAEGVTERTVYRAVKAVKENRRRGESLKQLAKTVARRVEKDGHNQFDLDLLAKMSRDEQLALHKANPTKAEFSRAIRMASADHIGVSADRLAQKDADQKEAVSITNKSGQASQKVARFKDLVVQTKKASNQLSEHLRSVEDKDSMRFHFNGLFELALKWEKELG